MKLNINFHGFTLFVNKIIIIIVFFAFPFYNGNCTNEAILLELPEIFSDHMVLQRNMSVPVWGKSQPGSTVVVKFLNQEHSVIASKIGEWRILLSNLNAGGPFEMKISNGISTIEYEDVLVGDVWFGSGQSNMEWAIYSSHPNHKKIDCDIETQELIGKAEYPEIRISSRCRDFLNTPNGGWIPFEEKISKDLPATMACLAIRLHREQNIPIGIIVRAISSSPSGHGWTKM
jgi:sialate O-acetylesterase